MPVIKNNQSAVYGKRHGQKTTATFITCVNFIVVCMIVGDGNFNTVINKVKSGWFNFKICYQCRWED